MLRFAASRKNLSADRHRPACHFVSPESTLNDPNGQVYYNGLYHLCFQHMPPGRTGAYKDWGHAVSTDLVHWKQLTSAITPHRVWGGCWSGSAVVDWDNTTGFQRGKEKPIVAILTNAGEPNTPPPSAPNTQCIAFSLDGGRTFTYYDKNPVLPHLVAENRDPKVVWHAPTKKWIMALYLTGNDYGLYAWPNLKTWEHLGNVSLPGDLFEIQAEIEPGAAAQFGFDVRGHKVEYDVKERKLAALGRTASLSPENGRIKLHVLVDRTSVEIFGNDGRLSMSSCFLPKAENKGLGVFSVGGTARIASLKVYRLKSAWNRQYAAL